MTTTIKDEKAFANAVCLYFAQSMEHGGKPIVSARNAVERALQDLDSAENPIRTAEEIEAHRKAYSRGFEGVPPVRWVQGGTYFAGQVVEFSGNQYRALQDLDVSLTPPSRSRYWTRVMPGA